MTAPKKPEETTKETTPPTVKTVKVASGGLGLTVRSAPEIANNAIGTREDGAELEVLEEIEGWIRVTENGWVNAEFVV